MIKNILFGNINNFQNVVHQQSIKSFAISFLVKKNLLQNYNRNFSGSSNNELAPEDKIPIVFYDEIKSLPTHPEKLLIDVREPEELKATGVIPTSINIPLGDVSNKLRISTGQFKEIYRRHKPSQDTEVIFSCKSGIRSAKAAVVAEKLGFKNVRNYKGSWTEWATKEGLPIE